MAKPRIGNRELKKIIEGLLRDADPMRGMNALRRLPPKQVINPLLMFLYHPEETMKWRAVSALGWAVSTLADENMESARVIMRRLMWNLNSESGGIGWGSAEAMGEIMACHKRLADEYAAILLSYIGEGESFIENTHLQKGVLWGLGRLTSVRPSAVKEGAPRLIPFLRAEDTALRGLAAWVAQKLGDKRTSPLLEQLAKDTEVTQIHIDNHPVRCRIADLARGVVG